MSFGGFGSHAHESDLNGIIFHIFFEDVPRHSGQADTAIPRLSRSYEASSSCRTVGKLGGLGSFQDRVSVQELGAIQVPPEASFPFVPVCSHPPTPAKKETNTWWGGYHGWDQLIKAQGWAPSPSRVPKPTGKGPEVQAGVERRKKTWEWDASFLDQPPVMNLTCLDSWGLQKKHDSELVEPQVFGTPSGPRLASCPSDHFTVPKQNLPWHQLSREFRSFCMGCFPVPPNNPNKSATC